MSFDRQINGKGDTLADALYDRVDGAEDALILIAKALERIAVAVEAIANALEAKP